MNDGLAREMIDCLKSRNVILERISGDVHQMSSELFMLTTYVREQNHILEDQVCGGLDIIEDAIRGLDTTLGKEPVNTSQIEEVTPL